MPGGGVIPLPSSNFPAHTKSGKRIAVIENEFGEIDIDSELVAKQVGWEGMGESGW